MPFQRDLYYRWEAVESGRGNGLTVLLIHGLGSSHSFYDPLMRSLKQKGYSSLAFDTPGSALSKGDGKQKTPVEIARRAGSLLSDLGIDTGNLVVVGHSMGALIACELEAIYTLRGVVLIGPVQPSQNLAKVFEDRIQKVQQDGLESLADAIPIAATGSGASSAQRAFIRSLILSQTPEGYVSLCRTIAEASPPAYQAARCPLFLLAGGQDKTSPIEGSREILASWGNKKTSNELYVIEQIGHWHCIEAPDEVGNSIMYFLDKLN